MLASSSMKASSNLFSFQMEDEDVVVSDVEEGSSVVSEMEVEEEESDSEFFDAMEGKPITFKKVGESSLMKSGFKSRRMQGSSMMMSTMG